MAEPRLFSSDILENFLVDASQSRDALIQKQVKNVTDWCFRKMETLYETVTDFCSVVLSIDQNFYGNHPLSIKTKKF